MRNKYYTLDTMGTADRKQLFEADPKTYVYSVLHEIVDRSFDLVEAHEDELSASFHETLPFEVLTQLLNFMSGVYDHDEIFENIRNMEQLLKEQMLLRKIQ